MESRTQGSRSRPRIQKKSVAKDSLPRTDLLEAKDSPFEDRPSRGQGQEPRTQRGSDLQKKSFAPKFRKFSAKFERPPGKKMSSKNFSQAIWCSSGRNKICLDLGPFSRSQRIVLSSSRGLGIFEDLQGSRPRPKTSNCVLEDSTSVYQSIFLV